MAEPSVTVSVSHSDPDRSRKALKYKDKSVCCCCCNIKAKNAVLVIASLTFVTSLIEMLTFPANETLDVIHKVILAMTNTAWIFASISAFASVNYRNHYLLFPLYAMLAVSTVALPLIIVLCYVSLLVIDDPYRNESAVKEWVYRMVVAMFSLPFSVWFMLVVRRCYKNFRKYFKQYVDMNGHIAHARA
ncbi:hypothetical protein QR680_010278 [Steinernema hermaphroditum]|uniref:Uncharacterized protein n=1 Tax=Steinernema hermaphroditum TaxID=289476 RepID=A0AA39MBF4_9BILA|nr:hypothetical protein QR680_010278 [Steinernema hermaphroditum]